MLLPATIVSNRNKRMWQAGADPARLPVLRRRRLESAAKDRLQRRQTEDGSTGGDGILPIPNLASIPQLGKRF